MISLDMSLGLAFLELVGKVLAGSQVVCVLFNALGELVDLGVAWRLLLGICVLRGFALLVVHWLIVGAHDVPNGLVCHL